MSKWFYFNIILLLLSIWQVVNHFSFPILSIPILFGFIGFLLFLFNWTRNAVFSTIRNTPDRKTKIKFVNISKKVMPFHRWTGTLALVFILLHAISIFYWYGFSFQNSKMVVGLLALLNLILMVITGWWRLIKPTGKLRRTHLRLGIALFFLIGLHLLL
ncbi:ferric reductase-like transmembrane domain-containing protein [Oceanobacillus polygoni]|uniref:Ferric reductase n=1 Tax=Oceanobacillus polygoni TaxID=1235259 RepID=A0A9X0YXX2_9BACI|nr:ferric reductase-like transmembrane domain-containing protein [Oceanobacillus polygoni]MBP2079866.1 putative ferric reductase [Oceanobacillus polygoni]